MQLVIDKLGKVAVTVEESYWNIDKDYDKLTIVEKEGIFGTYISRKPVPAGTELTNRLYWIPFSSVKESIVLDYNKFLDACKKVLDGHTEELSEHETRLTTVENNFKNHIDDTIVKFAQLDKSILDAANERGAISSKLSTVEDTAKKNKAALDILNGTGEGSISDQIADAIAEVIAGAPENLDTLKELADWIKTHGAEAATMNSKIKANETSIANIETNIDTIEKNVSDNTNDIINIKAENKETKAEVNKLKKDVSDNTTSIAVNSEKITTLEGKVATNTNDINTNANKIAKNELDIETNTAHIIALENNTINGHKISSNPVIDGSEIAVGDITTSSSTEFDNLEITKDTKINEAISSLQNKIKESTNIRSTNEFEVEADKNYKIASISNDIKTTFVLVVTATLNNSTNSYIINYNINASNTELKVYNSYISSGDVEDLILSVVFNSYDLNIKFNKAVKFTATFINFEYNILKVPTVVEDITSYSELTYIIDFYPNKVYFEGKEVTADKFIKKGGTSTEVLYADGSAKEIKEPTPLNPTIPSVENIVAFDDMPFNSTNTDVIKNAIGILKKLDVRPYSEHCEEITLQKITGTFQLFELNSSSDYFDTDCIFEIYRNVNDKPNLTWYVKFRILIENNNVFYDILDVSYGLSILNWMSIYKTQNSYKIVFNQHGQVYNDDYKIFIKQTTSHNNYFTTNVIYNIDYSTTEGAELIYNQIDLRNKTNNIDFRNIPNTTINNYIDHKKIKLSDKYTKIATIENINFNNSIDIDTVLKFTYFKNNSYGEEDISTNYNSKTNTFLLHIHKKSEEDFDIDNLKVLCDVLENNSNNIRLRIVYNGDKIDIYAERLKDDLYYGNNYKIDVIHYSSNFKLLDEYETFNHITGTILCSTEESTDSTIIKTPIKFKQLSIENGTSNQLIAGDGSLVPIRQTITISGPTVMGIKLDKYRNINHVNYGEVISVVLSINNPTHSAINKPRIERLAFDISFYDNLTSSSYSKIKVKLVDLKYTNYYDITNDSANIEFYYFWSDSVFYDTSLYIKFNGINKGSYDVVSNGYKIYSVNNATIQTKIDTINLPSYPNIPNGTIIDLNYPLLSNELIITNPSNPTQNPNIIDTSFFTEYNALKTKVDSILQGGNNICDLRPMCFVIDQRWLDLSDPVGMVSENYILGSDGTLQSISNSGADGNPNNNTLTWLRQNTHAYVGRYTGSSGVRLKQLDDTTRKKFADGTSSVDYISNESGEFDVWMKINSDVYIKTEPWIPIGASVPDPDYVLVTIARELPVGEDETKWEKFSQYNLYGVYKACRINDKLYSLSGKRPINNISQTQSKSQARARGNGFKIVDYKFSKLIAFLFYGYYSTLDSQTQLGYGTANIVNNVYYPKITGQTDDIAGADTNSVTGNGAVTPDNDQIIAGEGSDIKSNNFWHLENIQGDISEWLDDIKVMQAKRPSSVTDSNPAIYLSDYVSVYGYPIITKSGKDYQLTSELLEAMNEKQIFITITDIRGNITRIIQHGDFAKNSEGYIKKMCFGDHADIIAKEFGASANSGFCDYDVVSSAGHVAFRSSESVGPDGGVGFLYLYGSASGVISSVGSRLLYEGSEETIHIIDDATESL